MRAIPIRHTATNAAIGSRLRAARQEQQMTIEQLADHTSLTKGFISRVERDKVSPSVSSLIAICDVLNVPIGDLFASSDAQLIRADEAPQINLGGTGTHERLMTPRRESRMQVIRSTVTSGASGGAELYTVSSEVDVLLVISGSITVIFSDTKADLEAGDALTFDGREPHSWYSDTGAELIWALAPAAWAGTT